MKPTAYRHKSVKGPFWIAHKPDGRWHVIWEDENLGSYVTAQQACDDVAGGTTFWPSCGDPTKLGLSDDLGDWEPLMTRFE